MEIKYLKKCEVGVPDGFGDVENCNEPAIAILFFNDCEDEAGLYVCGEHLEEIKEQQ